MSEKTLIKLIIVMIILIVWMLIHNEVVSKNIDSGNNTIYNTTVY